MLTKQFYEDYPLYKTITTTTPSSPDHLEPFVPPIKLQCETCDGATWNNQYHQVHAVKSNKNLEVYLVAIYSCSDCKTNQSVFVVRFFSHGRDVVCRPVPNSPPMEVVHRNVAQVITEAKNPTLAMKVGQFPPWSLSISKPLEKALGKYKSYYKKGLACESHSYGIGAYSYYRRIVEGILDGLLPMVTELIPEGEGRDKYLAALEAIKDGRQTQDKCDLVKDLLPASMRPEGMNPLGILHHALSEGLHALEDQECLALAEEMRAALDFFVGQLETIMAGKKQFTESIRKILEKKQPKA